mgnify:CR=1 FL=1
MRDVLGETLTIRGQQRKDTVPRSRDAVCKTALNVAAFELVNFCSHKEC